MAKGTLRLIRVDGNIAYIPLTRGKIATVDASDVPLIDGVNWYALVQAGQSYAVREVCLGAGKSCSMRMHRVIMGEPEGLEVDHINGDGLDNRRDNLRIATKSQNAHNTGPKLNNKSGAKGVHWASRDKRWVASIMHQRGRHNLGSHLTLQAAADAYEEAAERLHGEFKPSAAR